MAAMSFKFTTINNPNAFNAPDGNGTHLYGISSKTGVIIGAYDKPGDLQVGFFDFLGNYTTLLAPPGGISSATFGINDSADYVGTYQPSNGTFHGYAELGGVLTLLDDPNTTVATVAIGINDSDKIVGYYVDVNSLTRAFTYTNGVYSDLNVPGAAKGSAAIGINASGDITGYYVDAGNNVHGFLDHSGSFTTLNVPGAAATTATGINDSGQIVGQYYDASFNTRGFLYSGGVYTTFDAPDTESGKTSAWGINNAGVIVGGYQDSSGVNHGYVASRSTEHDVYGAGAASVLWRSDSGLAAWDMSGSSIFASGTVTCQGQTVAPDASWKIAGTADFNADGAADMLWRQDGSGALALWQMQGSKVTASNAITSNGSAVAPDASWSVAGVGDFTGDSQADILWRQGSTGALTLWSMNGSAVTSSDVLTSNGSTVAPDASWNVAAIADFNGDGYTDVLWHQDSGALSMWDMNGSNVASSSQITAGGNVAAPDASWAVAGVGDFNHDGQADLLWRQSSGALALWQMNNSAIVSSGALTSQGNAVAPDASWKIVEVGDFNGDGNSDLLWRNDNGTMAEWLMNGSKITASVAPTSQGNAVSPDASWSVQGQPTMFA
jgi:probable HAF family extracellular repeat protein